MFIFTIGPWDAVLNLVNVSTKSNACRRSAAENIAAASAVLPESVQSSDSDGSYLDSDDDHDCRSSIQRGLQKSIISQRVIALIIWLRSPEIRSQKCGLFLLI